MPELQLQAPEADRAATNGARAPRWRRRVLTAQGLYYVTAGVWPLLHFPSFAGALRVPLQGFQTHAVAAILVVIGACLLECVRRGRAEPYAAMLGGGTAGAIATVELVWLPRFPGIGALWLDLPVQVAFVIALLLLRPRDRIVGTTPEEIEGA